MLHIISLGGSLIAPDHNINWQYLKKFRQFILDNVAVGHKFLIITGGGQICREYQKAASKVVKPTDESLDWLGIHATHLNAHLLRTILPEVSYPSIITKSHQKFNTIRTPVVIAAGWQPGNSTDYIAVLLAKKYNVKTVINLSNIDYVYTKDPKKYKNAKKITQVSWDDFNAIIGTKWLPGLNKPFDPVASIMAKRLKLTVIIMNGNKLRHITRYLSNSHSKIQGTVIS